MSVPVGMPMRLAGRVVGPVSVPVVHVVEVGMLDRHLPRPYAPIMFRRAGSLLLLLGFLLAMAPTPGWSMGCGSMAGSGGSWTQLGGSAGGCTTSMPAATCFGGICAALPTPHELAVVGMEHHLPAFLSSDLISHSPPPPQPPPPEA